MIGHLGTRVSALLDGQLSAKETEEAWTHVYSCHVCRDLVEREGWVKTRLAGLCDAGAGDAERCAPSGLKGSLLSMPPGEALLAGPEGQAASRRTTGAVVLGGSAVGAAMLGVLAFGFLPGSAPPADRRPPATQISVPSTPNTPTRVPVAGSTAALSGGTAMVPTPLRRMLP